MRATILGAAAGLLGLAATAAAQQAGPSYGGLNYAVPGYPTFNPQNAKPNVYNPRNQPLSPYLNLLRGGNPGVNYFYGVRPGTTGAVGGTGPAVPFGYSQLRGGFIPTASNPEQEPVSVSADTTIPYIPSAAHPVVFGGGRPAVGGLAAPIRSGFAGTQMPPTAPRRPTK